MKRIIFLILIGVALINPGCETIDFGDTNKNVNGPGEANTATLLSGAITRYYTRTGRPYWVTPSLNVQYMSQLVYVDEMLYADVAGFWDAYYSQTLSNLDLVIKTCSDPANATDALLLGNGALENQIGVAKIMKSVIFKRVTDCFGDVPYSESMIPGVLLPVYDRQEDIYKGMIAEVKAARDMLDATKAGPKGDVIYAGNINRWKKFANSFLLSLSMQLSKKYPTNTQYAAVEFNSALTNAAGVIQTVADEAWFKYDIANAYNNPWNWIRPADYSMSKEFSDALKGNGFTSNTTRDNRIDIFIKNPALEGLAYGYNNAHTPPGVYSEVAAVIINPASDLAVMTASYTFLNRAEAAARGWTTEVVNTMLTNGITFSYATLAAHYDATNIFNIGNGNAYAAARVADAGTVAGGALRVIGEEKWVALFPLGFEAWSEWRRTNYPALTPAVDAVNSGVIPRRYNYPSTESSLNAASYATGVSRLTPATDNNSSRFWWDVN
jgi:hypothetical protein